MENDLILRKLENLRFYLQRIKEKTPSSCDLFCDDLDAQDIIVLNLSRAIQECVDIALHIISEDNSIPVPDSMAQAFLTLRQINIISAETAQNLARAVGFRNIAVHAYQQIDWHIVFQIVTSKLDDFRKFAQEITTNRQIF